MNQEASSLIKNLVGLIRKIGGIETTSVVNKLFPKEDCLSKRNDDFGIFTDGFNFIFRRICFESIS